MIKNERQRQVTEQQRALLAAARDVAANGEDFPLREAQLASLDADIAGLDADLLTYARSMAGDIDLSALAAAPGLGAALIQARIASSLTQSELARRLGRKAQQVQRYEREQYRTASLETVNKVAGVLHDAVRGRRNKAAL